MPMFIPPTPHCTCFFSYFLFLLFFSEQIQDGFGMYGFLGKPSLWKCWNHMLKYSPFHKYPYMKRKIYKYKVCLCNFWKKFKISFQINKIQCRSFRFSHFKKLVLSSISVDKLYIYLKKIITKKLQKRKNN